MEKLMGGILQCTAMLKGDTIVKGVTIHSVKTKEQLLNICEVYIAELQKY